jgi:hypothetical protein
MENNYYICEKCKKILKSKSYLQNHMQTCQENVDILMNERYLLKCTFENCKSEFNSVKTRSQHIKKYHLQSNNNDKLLRLENGKPQTVPVTPSLTKTVNKYITQNITKNIANIGNINNINIQPLLFVKHGDERTDHITKEFLLKILNYTSSQKMFVDLMATLYFSSEVPENNNWMLAYPYNENAAVVYDENTKQFKRTSTEQIINEKFSNMIDKLVPLIDEIYNSEGELTKAQRLNILHFYDKECVYDLSNKYPDIYNLIRKLAYEQRFIPMTTWKEQGFNGNHLSIKF